MPLSSVMSELTLNNQVRRKKTHSGKIEVEPREKKRKTKVHSSEVGFQRPSPILASFSPAKQLQATPILTDNIYPVTVTPQDWTTTCS